MTPDPARTPLFYWLLAIVGSLVLSTLSYTLLLVTQHGQSLTALETWRMVRSHDVERESALLQQVRDASAQHTSKLAAVDEQLRLLHNGASFHEAQIAYIIAWDKRLRDQDELQMRRYPR